MPAVELAADQLAPVPDDADGRRVRGTVIRQVEVQSLQAVHGAHSTEPLAGGHGWDQGTPAGT